MSDRDIEHALPGVLRRATAGLPRNSYRYEQIERRGQRRARRFGVLGTAACLVLAIGVSGSVLRDQLAGTVAEHAGTNQTALGSQASTPSVPRCPSDRSVVNARGEPLGFDKAYRTARLCDPTEPDTRIVLGPVGTEKLLIRLRALPKSPEASQCGGSHGTRYDLVLSGPEQPPAYLSLEDFGCAADDLATYIESLAARR